MSPTKPFLRRALLFPLGVATVLPQPQAAGQTLDIGPGANGGTSYTVSSGGETWDSVYLGYNGTGTLNHSAGTLTITNQLWLGFGSAGNGIYNLSGAGVLSAPTEIIGYSASAVGTFNQNGGTNTTPSLKLSPYAGSSGTYSLNGGTLQAGSVTGGGSGSVFDFNGGTLQATAATGSFLQGLTYTNVQTGGAFIDSNGYNVTVAQSLLHDTSAGAPATDGGLTKLGAGTLTLTGGNTYVGVTTMAGGVLNVASVSDYGTASAIGSRAATAEGASNVGLLFEGGTLQYTGSTNQSTNRQIRLGNNTTNTIDSSGSGTLSFTYSGTNTDLFENPGTRTLNLTGTNTGSNVFAIGLTDQASNATSLTKAGAGTWVLAGANTNTGATTINAGTLAYGGAGGSSGGGGFTLAGGNLLLNTSGTVTASGVSFTNGASSVTLQAGTLQIASGGTISGAGGLIFQGGTLRAGGAFTLPSGLPISIQPGGGTVDTSGGNITSGSAFGYSGGAAGSSNGTGTFTVQGGHVLQADLTSNSGWTGPTVITGSGTTFRNNGGNYTAAGTLTVGAGAFYDLNNSGVSFGGLAGAGTVLNTGGSGGVKTLTLTGAGGNTFSGSIAPAGGATEAANTALTINLNSSGVETFTGNNTYTGGTTISAGTLQVGNGGTSGSLGAGAIIDNAALVFNRAGNLTQAGVISGGGSLTLAGNGTLILTGNNTYTGATTISAGTLQVGNGGTSGSLGTGAISDNGTLAFNHSDALTVATTISGTGAFIQQGSGTLTLLGNNTYMGGTFINAGTLQVGNGGTAGNLGPIMISNNGTLVFNHADNLTEAGAILGSGTLTQAGSGTLTLTGYGYGGGATFINAGTLQVGDGGTSGSLGGGTGVVVNNTALVFNCANNLTQAGAISGGGTLTQAGSGTLTLTGNNTYTGATAISAGTLQVGNGGTAGSLVAGGAISDNGTLAFNHSDAVTIATTISGTGAFVQLGSGTLTLLGNNTYTGGTTISAGTLQVGNGGTSGSLGAGAIIDNAALVFNRADNLTEAGVISGSGSLTQTGSGTLTLLGNNTYTGGATINAGTLQVGNGGTSGSLGTNGVLNNGALVFNRADNLTEAISIQGTGTLTQAGSGTLTLTGSDFFLGAAYINAGTLQVGNGGISTGLSPGAFVNNAALVFNLANNVNEYAVISGRGTLTQAGSGTLNLGLSNTYTGATYINAGTLQAGVASNAFGNNSAVVLANVAGATLDLHSFNETIGSLAGGGSTGGNVTLGTGTLTVGGNNASTTYAGVLNGTGGLIQVGSGTLTLLGNNAYTGVTTISAGTLAANNASGSATGTGAVTVQTGGTLGGGGTVAGAVTIQSGATLDPGLQLAVARLTLGNNLTLNAGANLTVELGGSAPGTGYSQLRLTAGTLSLAGSNLHVVELAGFSLAVGQTFVLLDNTSTAAATAGTFANTTLGGSLYTDAAGNTFQVNYAAMADNDSVQNDVMLTVQSVVPEPSTWTLLGVGAAGLGFMTLRRRACRP